MTSDRKHQIWASALAAEHDHGDAAESHANRQSALATVAGDSTEAAIWKDVAALLQELHSIGQPLKTLGPSGFRQL